MIVRIFYFKYLDLLFLMLPHIVNYDEKDLKTGCNHLDIMKSDIENHHKKSNGMIMFLFSFSAIALSLLPLSTLTLTVNTQPYSPSPVSSTNSASSRNSGDTQMGICVAGAGGPCNGDR
jgi:hypothetical protein